MKKCWLLAAWLAAAGCLCDTKEKYFIHLTGGGHRLAAAACPQSMALVTEEAKENWKQGETGYSTQLRLNIFNLIRAKT